MSSTEFKNNKIYIILKKGIKLKYVMITGI